MRRPSGLPARNPSEPWHWLRQCSHQGTENIPSESPSLSAEAANSCTNKAAEREGDEDSDPRPCGTACSIRMETLSLDWRSRLTSALVNRDRRGLIVHNVDSIDVHNMRIRPSQKQWGYHINGPLKLRGDEIPESHLPEGCTVEGDRGTRAGRGGTRGPPNWARCSRVSRTGGLRLGTAP